MKKNILLTWGLILVVSLFAVFLRVRVLALPAISQIAETEVYNSEFNKIKEEVNKMYKVMPENKKSQLIQQSYNNFKSQYKYLLGEKVKQKASERKAFYQNENNHTYMLGIDSYYWLRLIDNLIKKGHIGDSIVNGQDYDDLVGMPIEKSLSRSSHLILGKLVYNFLDLLKLNVDYELGLYLIPILISVLLVIFTFFITKLLSRSNTAAFFASVAVNFCPLVLQRTMGEWLDTDIYSVFFPMIIFGAFLMVFKSADKLKKALGVLGFAISCSIYASIWQGWWHIFVLLILCGLVFIINGYVSEDKNRGLLKKNLGWLFSLFFLGILFVGLFNGRESFFSFIAEPYKMISVLKDVPQDNWPNVFLTVAELKKVAPYRIAQELGGIPIFFITIMGSIYLVLAKKVIRDNELGIGFFCLFIWLGVLYYTSLNAIRFALLLIVPLGIMFGIVFDKMLRAIFTFSLKFSKKIHFACLGALVLCVYLFISFYFSRSMDIAYAKVPMINDAWYNSLVFIKNNSPKDAVINSWWDFGHWFKAIAQRRVLFDGKTQNSPIAFWMAKSLVTADEAEAVGILRMLDISKNEAFDLLDSNGISHTKAAEMLLEAVKMTEPEARTYLSGLLKEDQAAKLMALLFRSDLPQAYYIVSYDMVSKMRSISHIGNWDFEKGDIWIKSRKLRLPEFINYLKKEYSYSKEEAMSLRGEIGMLSEREAPAWISQVNTIDVVSMSNKYRKDADLLFFDNDLVVNLANDKAYLLRGKGVDIGVPYSIAYMEEGVLQEKILEDSNLEYSVLIFKTEDDLYKSIFLDKNLVKSMFVRLYFLKGEGLKFFQDVLEEQTPDKNSVYVYQINWPE